MALKTGVRASAIVVLLIGGSALATIGGCSMRTVDAGEVGVLVRKPFLFGTPGVDPQALSTGMVVLAPTTSMVVYDVRPFRRDETFTDLITLDNVPVSFTAYIRAQLDPGQVPRLHEKFGPGFYEANMQQPFRTMVRDFARSHRVFELTTDPAVTTQGQGQLQEQLTRLLASMNLPVTLDSVGIGAVAPPKEVLDETARTAAQQQRAKTEAARANAELSRKAAEENKALADKAYATSFGMNAHEFLTYRSLEIQRELVEAVKDKPNVNVLVSAGGGIQALPTFSTEGAPAH